MELVRSALGRQKSTPLLYFATHTFVTQSTLLLTVGQKMYRRLFYVAVSSEAICVNCTS